MINIPKWPQVNVKELFEHCCYDDTLMAFLPLKFSKGRKIDRKFFFNILNTVHPDHVQMIIKNATAKRFEIQESLDQKETITISQHWHEELLKIPFQSSQILLKLCCIGHNGKTVLLLKSKASLRDKSARGLSMSYSSLRQL